MVDNGYELKYTVELQGTNIRAVDCLYLAHRWSIELCAKC